MANAQESRRTFFNEYGINPYEIIGVTEDSSPTDIKKAYKYKARILHPDKNYHKDSTDEFKILGICYDFIIHEAEKNQVKVKPASNWNTLKQNSRNAASHFGASTSLRRGAVDHNLFTVGRKETLDDDLDVVKLEQELKFRSMSTTYDRNEKVFNVFKDGKFNAKKFNALFEYMKQKQEDQQQVSVSGASESGPLAYMPASGSSCASASVSTYNGLLLVDRGTTDYSINGAADYKRVKEEALIHPQEHLDQIITEKDINKILKNIEKETKKISKRKVTQMLNKRKEPLNIQHQLTFAEAELAFQEQKVRSMKQEMEKNERVFQRYGHLYGDELLYQAQQGLLEDSSTCIKTDENNQLFLTAPTGTRRVK